MNYRSYHGNELSEIGLGCYGLSGAYGKKDPEAYKAVLRLGFENGVNVFDTAEGYGIAEQTLGEAVQPFRSQVFLCTKVGVKSDSRPDLSRAYIQQACEHSLRALQTSYIDLYQVHFDDPSTPVEETVQALDGLVREGKIRYYGLGHLPSEKVAQYVACGQVFSMLMEYSAAARYAEAELLPLCREKDVAAIAFSVTARGLLTGKIGPNPRFEPGDIRNMDPLFQRERLQSGLRIAGRLAALGDRHGKTPAQVAIAWVLAQPGILCALTGPSTPEKLLENLGGSGWQIPVEDMRPFNQFLDEEALRLAAEQRQSVRDILCQPLAEAEKAFVDLVYALETAITLGWTSEDQVMPLFHELFALRSQLNATSHDALRSIQSRLRERLEL